MLSAFFNNSIRIVANEYIEGKSYYFGRLIRFIGQVLFLFHALFYFGRSAHNGKLYVILESRERSNTKPPLTSICLLRSDTEQIM